MGRSDMEHPWIFARCREVEEQPDGYLDLWAREHYKSTIITLGGAIQEILKDPEITIGIFSHTKPIARKFLRQIKTELERNELLHQLFPDLLYADPQKESPRWSEDSGICVRRKSNPKEATVEAWGLVDGQPTSAHYRLMIYDDVVTKESVSTPEQVSKTTESWELSDNLGVAGGRKWHIGTRYSYGDTYQSIMDRGSVIPRIYAATDDGTADGNPILMTPEIWAQKKRDQGPSTIACQQLQDPIAGKQALFRLEWLQVYEVRPATLTVYLIVDPASSKKKGTDYTAMAVIGVDAARNKYLLDGRRHKMGLRDRWEALSTLRRHWNSMPGVQSVFVGYERYGMQSDIEYFEERMALTGDHFPIQELAWPREGGGSKIDRVQRLEPDLRNGRFYVPLDSERLTKLQQRVTDEGSPYRVSRQIRGKDDEGNVYDLVEELKRELVLFPYGSHDDLIDAVSRIYDMDYQPPVYIPDEDLEPEVFDD